MAKIIWKELSKDDPIFNGGFVISSFPRQRVPQPKLDKDPDAQSEETGQQVKKKTKPVDWPNSRKG